ncbi:MAG: DUF2339 domain-containing protein [Sphingomonas bacterium]|nr:DUF2339 domain-containing protein [Sphingomonas bacterium]
MILWAIAAGALIGWSMADFSGFGLVFGGMIGAAMGGWLRSAIRKEIAQANDRALAWHSPPDIPVSSPDAVEPRLALAPRSALQPAAEPAQAQADYDDGSAASQTLSDDEPREPSPVEQWLGKARAWMLGGNTIVRVGLVILFVGLTFLARLVAHAGLLPIEARLALVAVAGAALLALGYNKRIKRPAFGLALQGTGVAVLYLTVFGAARIFGLMPPLAAFGLMIVFAALGCALALLQDARGMAFASFLGGFAVPLLLGGEAKTPTGLFTYFTILNLALLTIAWRRSWRELNLLGFVATFGMATLWGMTSYAPQHYLVCQIFLGLTMAIYLAAALLYAGNTPGRLGNAADSTLLFGPAIAGFGLEVGLVQDRAFGSAFAALAFGAGYLAIAAVTLRRRQMRLLNECLLAIGVGFVTLAVPLALDARWTSSAWALEGVGAFWIGVRQARWMPRAFGLLLQLIAALILFSTLSANISSIPLANNGFIGAALVAIPLLLTAWWMRRRLPHSESNWAKRYAEAEFGLRHAIFLGGFVLAAIALIQEVMRRLPALAADDYPRAVFQPHQQVLLIMLALLGAAGLADWFGRRTDWGVATWPARASLLLITMTFFVTLAMGRHVLFGPDWMAWMLALGGHYALLRRSDAALQGSVGDRLAKWNYAAHAGGAWLVTAMLADSLQLGINRGELWNTSWAGVIFLISAVAVLAALTRWAGRAAPLAEPERLHWPLDPAARAYWWVAAVPLAALAYFGAMMAALVAEGVTNPLPYVPLVNPVDLSVGLALVALALWRRMVGTAHDKPDAAGALLGKPALIAGGVLAFVAINGMWLRTAHHWLGVGWTAEALGQSPVVQTGLAILWTLMAMGLMLFARRRALRVSWLVGAGLLVVVVIKLLLVDMSKAQGWERIVTFIGVGVLMLVIGYFVPLPPRKTGEEKLA